MTTESAAAAAYTFPADLKASVSHWWSTPKNASQLAEEGLVRRGLGEIELVSPEEVTKRAAAGITKKIAVFRDVLLDGLGVKGSDRKRWFLHSLEGILGQPIKDEAESVTIVCHGYGNGLGFYFQNLQALTSQPATRTYFLDWLGMGRSGRPSFPYIKTSDDSPAGVKARVTAAENFFVDSLEEFRIKSEIKRPMTLVGHSIGGYLSSAYALRFPENVKKLVLISPVGVPLSPYAPAAQKGLKKTTRDEGAEIAAALEHDMLPSASAAAESSHLPPAPKTWWTYLWEKNYSPFGVLRGAGFMGPSLLSRYASRRFATFEDDVKSDLFSYLYEISTARGSGEYCLAHLLAPGAYGRSPLLERLDKLDVPITFIYGDHDWMDSKGGYDVVKKLKAKAESQETADQKRYSRVIINPHSGHWVHLENPEGFNQIIERILQE
ncbi:hypothetical protein RQP46_008327 [Phenoliferia psychrophenolica]